MINKQKQQQKQITHILNTPLIFSDPGHSLPSPSLIF